MVKKLKKTLLGALIFGIAGFIAGVLFAPQEGKKTRGELKQKSTELVEQVREKAKKQSEVLRETGEVARSAYEEIVDEVLRSLKKGKEFSEEQVKEIRSLLLEKRTEIVDSLHQKKKDS